MRCPQCGYISFDHTANCGKCSGSLIEANRQLNGTGLKTHSPSFLLDPAPPEPVPSNAQEEIVEATTETPKNEPSPETAETGRAPGDQPSSPAINLEFDPDLGSQPSEEELMVNLEDIELTDLVLEQKTTVKK